MDLEFYLNTIISIFFSLNALFEEVLCYSYFPQRLPHPPLITSKQLMATHC
jgi:hypothetical protein